MMIGDMSGFGCGGMQRGSVGAGIDKPLQNIEQFHGTRILQQMAHTVDAGEPECEPQHAVIFVRKRMLSGQLLKFDIHSVSFLSNLRVPIKHGVCAHHANCVYELQLMAESHTSMGLITLYCNSRLRAKYRSSPYLVALSR